MALPLARALQDAEFKASDRAAIIMTNQSKWLISAYSIFYCGGVLVPLDYKLTRGRASATVGSHSRRSSGGRVPHLARHHARRSFNDHKAKKVLVTEAPPGADLAGAFRWEDFKRKGDPTFVSRKREDTACIVYSSGTGGPPERLRAHSRKLSGAVQVADGLVSVLAGSALPQHSSDQSRD